MVKTKRAVLSGASDRFRQWLEEEGSEEEEAAPVRAGGSSRGFLFDFSEECKGPGERTEEVLPPEGGVGSLQAVSQGVGKEEQISGEEAGVVSENPASATGGFVNNCTAAPQEVVLAEGPGMARGTPAKVGKSNGPLKNAAKGLAGGEVRIKDGRNKPEVVAATSKASSAPLSDIVGVEAQEAPGKRVSPGKVVHYTAVLAKGAVPDSSDSEEYSSAEETQGPLVPAFNPFKSKLSGKRPGERGKGAGISSADGRKKAEGKVASAAKAGGTQGKDNAALQKGEMLPGGNASGGKESGERGESVSATVEQEKKASAEVTKSLPENNHTELPSGNPSQEGQTPVADTANVANPKETPSAPGAHASEVPAPVQTEGAESRRSPPPTVGVAHVNKSLKQMPGHIVAEIDAIAEQISTQGGPVDPPKKTDAGLPPRNSISPGAAYLKLHSQGDTSLAKSPDGKPKHPIVNAFRERAHSTSSVAEGGGGSEAAAKGPVPNFWSRFIPVHAFQGGDQPGGAGSPHAGGAALEETPEGGEMRPRGAHLSRSVSEISPSEGERGGLDVEEKKQGGRAAEDNKSLQFARSKSMDSGAKARAPPSPMSVLPPRSGECTSPRSPHSPTKPPLPPILKTSSRFNGNSSSGNELAEDVDHFGGVRVPPLPGGELPKSSLTGGAQKTGSGRRDSPRRVSFQDDLPTLRKAASFSGGGTKSVPQGLPKAVSMPTNSEALLAAAAAAESKAAEKGEGTGKALNASEIMQTADENELLGAFGAAGMDLDGLIQMAEVHLREARKGMSPEAKKKSPRSQGEKPEPIPFGKPKPEGGKDVKAPYLSIPNFDEEEWNGEPSKGPSPKEKTPARAGRGEDVLAASQRAWEKKGRENMSQSPDSDAFRRHSEASGRQSDGARRAPDATGRRSDAINRSPDSQGQKPAGTGGKTDTFGRRSSGVDDFGRTSLQKLDPVLDTVLERVLAAENEFEDDLGSEADRAAESGNVKGRGKDAKTKEEVIYWTADDEADKESVKKLEREKASLQASLDERARQASGSNQKKGELQTKRKQLEGEVAALRQKAAAQRSLRSPARGSPSRREAAELKDLEAEVERMRKAKEELTRSLESSKAAAEEAERIWELTETKAQLEEDVARLMAQKAAGAFRPTVTPEQARLEADVARMKQELADLERQKGARKESPEMEMRRLKEERSSLELRLANAIGEIALESAMSPRGQTSLPDDFEELNLGLLEEGNARLQQQIQEVKQQAARQRAGIIIGSEERTQALQKLLETRNLYEEELAATVHLIMEEFQKNDEIEKMVQGNMSALERALAQQQQALSEAQEVLQVERMRSQTMRASVENISHAAAPAIPGLLKGRAYAAANASPQTQRGSNHFALNFHSLESGGSEYLSHQLSNSSGLVFRNSEIRRRGHDDNNSDDDSGSQHSRTSDNFQDTARELALTPPKNRLTELSSPSRREAQSRNRSEVLLRDGPHSPSTPKLVGGGGLSFQLEHSQERRNQIMRHFSGPLDQPQKGGGGAPRSMSVAGSPKQMQRPKSAGPLLGNRYSLG